MRLKPKVKEVEELLAQILLDDAKQTNRNRRTISPEVATAIGYLQVWGQAGTKLQALVKLAQNPAEHVVDRVLALGRENAAQSETEGRPSSGGARSVPARRRTKP